MAHSSSTPSTTIPLVGDQRQARRVMASPTRRWPRSVTTSRRAKSLSPLTIDDPVERRERDDIDQGARSCGGEKTKVWERHQSGNGADGDRRDDRADVQRS